MYFLLHHDSIQLPALKLQQQAPSAFCIIHVAVRGRFALCVPGEAASKHRRLRKNSAHKNSCPFAVLEFPLPEESVPRFWEGYRHGLEPAALEPYSITGQGCGVQQLLYLLWLRERFMDTRVLFKSIRKVCLTRVRTGSGVEKCASTKMVKNWVIWGLLGQIYKAQALWN